MAVIDNPMMDEVFSMLLARAGLLTLAALLPCATVYAQTNPAVTVTVDATASRHAINPMVYGVAYASAAAVADLNMPLNRYGGNNTSRYNWKLNADNRGSDYYFQSIADNSATPGERGDTFIRDTKSGGLFVQPMLTIPMLDYVATLATNRQKLASFSISKYGAQTGNDWQWFPDAGNGISSSTGKNITGNNPLDANVASDAAFQQGWVQHLVANWGTAAKGGLKYYILDNEPSIWHGTHRDVHPTGATMDEVKNKTIDYATRIKTVDPTALVVGPEEWGWSGYFYSGYDQQYGNTYGWGGSLPDRSSHANKDYLPYLLDQFKQNEAATGKRLLDVFSVHYYPQGGEFWGGIDTNTQLLRNRSTRSLWDPTYTDESWIGSQVQLIPRIKGWVNTYYPGTQTAITEYNWGAEAHINGATTQADILGIFGREGLDMAARWACPDASTPTYKAIKLYRNYDGNNNGFGDTSVSAAAPTPDSVSSFAAVRSSDGALTIMVISKVLTGTTPVTLNVSHFAGAASAQVWQLTSANTIQSLSGVALTGGAIQTTVPAQSITLFVVPQAAGRGTVSIPVTLGSYTGNSATVPLRVELRQAGTTTSLDHFKTNFAGGILSFQTARQGTYDIAVQGPTFLRKVIKNVTITASGASVAGITLTNGDVNGDNTVTLPDYTLVTRALGTTGTSASDLNGDGIVNAADQAIVTANMRKVGDQ